MPNKKSHEKTLLLPSCKEKNWKNLLSIEINNHQPGAINLDCNDWQFGYNDFKHIITLIEQAGLIVENITSTFPKTIIVANSLGYQAHLSIINKHNLVSQLDNLTIEPNQSSEVLFHKGTLRAGDHLNAEGDVLVLGDVNPGAKVSAKGTVMIWGCLRGIAHAGEQGNREAKIIALNLRPVQLRIADVIARGPEEEPQPGLAEQAFLKEGKIVIKPVNI